MSRKRSRSIISTGTVTIVLIFVMLCMVTFAVLSLASAQADLRLSQKNADRSEAYYDAENRASDILFLISDRMVESKGQPDESSWYSFMRSSLEGNSGITFTDDSHLNYSVESGEEQLLHVSLRLSYDGAGRPGHYEILAWQIVSTHDWEADEPLPVL